METRQLDGVTFVRLLQGGARKIRSNIKTINELNVFPVPDGDTGTNMSMTIDGGLAKIAATEEISLGEATQSFAQGSLLSARGNSGVILSQFFAGICNELSDKDTATVDELADAYLSGVKRSYAAVTKPVEGTILTVFRESAEYAKTHIGVDSTLEEFFSLNIEEAERSLKRTKDILPVLTEANVVDSGGAGYLCIARGMYESIGGKVDDSCDEEYVSEPVANSVNYDLFTSDSVLEWGYCTECLVRICRAKTDPSMLQASEISSRLEGLGCESIVAIKDNDIVKVHAHTMTPSDVLTLCQEYGEFLNIKIENMHLQHSEKLERESAVTKKPHKTYGVVTVATGEGMSALFSTLGADVVIGGGQSNNPSTEEFLSAYEGLNVDHIIVLPNNKNILLTARQSADLWGKGNVHVIPSKTIPEGYTALSVFNAAIADLDSQLSDMESAMESVVSGEVTCAIRNTVIGGVDVSEGEYIGILDGELVTSMPDVTEAMCDMLCKVDDIDCREILTLFVGNGVSDEARVKMTEAIEEQFPDLVLEVYIGGQEIYDYLISLE